MFTVIAQHRDAETRGQKTQAQPVADRAAAMELAETWSMNAPADVQIYRSGESEPLCVYRTGERIVCRCPDAARTGAPSPGDAS